MKTRNGFVSNSSSSSFIIVGCDVSLCSEEVKEKLLDEKFDYVGYYLDENDEDFIGDFRSVSDYEYKTITVKQLDTAAIEQKIKSIVPDADVKIWFGSRYS